MFANLSEKLQETFKKLRGRGKLSEQDVNEALREVRRALLEADVNFKVAKDFVESIRQRAIGQEVLESLTPGQHIIKIVNEQLVELLGGTQSRIAISPKPPTVIMLVGLQGAGKTTTAGKLAYQLKKDGKRPLLVAGDIYRPAAIKQLQVLGQQLEVPVFSLGDQTSPVEIAVQALQQAQIMARDVIIIDTAGRLHINQELMEELSGIRQKVKPHEILLVVDSMTGQDAVTVAEAFHAQLGIDGLIMTKLDGDARGGAALSIKAVTGRPIKYAGMGEKLDALEPFHPDRMASRILGMGDMLTLIEKAQTSFDEDQAKELEKKFRKDEFTLEDFLSQMQQIKKMGSIKQILGMIPGMGNKLKDVEVDEGQFRQIEAIIQSMTKKERKDPAIINGSRRKRIALGSGVRVQDVNRLLKQFAETRKMMKRVKGMQKAGRNPGFNLPFMR